MKLLERENRELRRANEILKSAAAFFAFLSTSTLPVLASGRPFGDLGTTYFDRRDMQRIRRRLTTGSRP